jgi:hypothetical protein
MAQHWPFFPDLADWIANSPAASFPALIDLTDFSPMDTMDILPQHNHQFILK